MNLTKSKKTILITRAAHQAGETVKKYQKQGWRVLSFPTIEIHPPRSWKRVDRDIQQIEKYDWVIFTSANAVDAFAERVASGACPPPDRRPRSAGEKRRRTPPRQDPFNGIKIATIGAATKRAVLKQGWKVSAVAKEERSEGLLKLCRRGGPLWPPAGKRILWPRAAKVRPVLAKGFKRLGVCLDQVVVYRSACPRGKRRALQKLLKTHKIDRILFMSEATRLNFFKIIGKDALPLSLALSSRGEGKYKEIKPLGRNLALPQGR